MEIKARVHEIGETQQVTDTFKKRDLILMYADNPQYPEYIKFEVHQDKTSLLDALSVNDEVEVLFNLRGRPWVNKEGITTYFNSLVAWKVNKLAAGSTPPPPIDINDPLGDGADDDLPF